MHNKHACLRSTTTVFLYTLDVSPLWYNGLCVYVQNKYDLCPAYPLSGLSRTMKHRTIPFFFFWISPILSTRDVFATIFFRKVGKVVATKMDTLQSQRNEKKTIKWAYSSFTHVHCRCKDISPVNAGTLTPNRIFILQFSSSWIANHYLTSMNGDSRHNTLGGSKHKVTNALSNMNCHVSWQPLQLIVYIYR